jgi:ABC-2 type transport system permease protein
MNGLIEVLRKELADYFSSLRFLILFLIILLAGIGTIFVAAQNIRTGITESTEFIFIRLFIVSGKNFSFTFPYFLALFIPIIGIAFGFDAINSERNSGNLSRLLSQPVYRDSVINAKFLAGLSMIAIMVTSLVIIVGGLGLRMIGVPPTAEEILRLFFFVVLSILYGAFWLSLSILFSIVFNRTATSVLVSIALWLFLFLFLPFIASFIANSIVPVSQNSSLEVVTQFDTISRAINRISPGMLYQEAVQVLLMPELGDPGSVLLLYSLSTGAMQLGSLPLSQSLYIVWPQIVSIIALAAICFAISYMRFMREEIRST